VIPLVVVHGIKLKDFGYDVAPLSFCLNICHYQWNNCSPANVAIAIKMVIENCISGWWHQQLRYRLLLVMLAYHRWLHKICCGEGLLNMYYFINYPHCLSIAIIPMVLVTYVRALAANFSLIRKYLESLFLSGCTLRLPA
jgi:putative membrane protein